MVGGFVPYHVLQYAVCPGLDRYHPSRTFSDSGGGRTGARGPGRGPEGPGVVSFVPGIYVMQRPNLWSNWVSVFFLAYLSPGALDRCEWTDYRVYAGPFDDQGEAEEFLDKLHGVEEILQS